MFSCGARARVYQMRRPAKPLHCLMPKLKQIRTASQTHIEPLFIEILDQPLVSDKVYSTVDLVIFKLIAIIALLKKKRKFANSKLRKKSQKCEIFRKFKHAKITRSTG